MQDPGAEGRHRHRAEHEEVVETLRIIMVGALLQLFCVLVNLQGQAEWNFVTALVLLGLGWNFLFVGGTTLLTSSYSGAEKFHSA